jgi:hypothetical protein
MVESFGYEIESAVAVATEYRAATAPVAKLRLRIAAKIMHGAVA